MNKERFKQVLDHIKADPASWNQALWHCNTTHCFAGHAQIMSGKAADKTKAWFDACRWLDITCNESLYLFSPLRTLADFEKMLAGYGTDGYGKDGYNADGYDREGYDKNGYDCEGLDREGFYRETLT